MNQPTQAQPEIVNVVWNISGSKRPIKNTIKDILHLMVTEHPTKRPKIVSIFTNFRPIVGLNLDVVRGVLHEIRHCDLRVPTVSHLYLGGHFVEIFFALEDKPAT